MVAVVQQGLIKLCDTLHKCLSCKNVKRLDQNVIMPFIHNVKCYNNIIKRNKVFLFLIFFDKLIAFIVLQSYTLSSYYKGRTVVYLAERSL